MARKQSNKTVKTKTRANVVQKSSLKPQAFWARKHIIFALIGIVLFIGTWWFFLGGSSLGTRLGMQSYLEDKYNKSFTVERPSLTDSGLAISGMWRATAYPNDDPTLKFEVNQSQSTNRYEDRYAGVVWSHQEIPDVEAFLKTIFVNVPEFTLDVHTIAIGPDSIHGDVPSFSKAVEQYGDEMYYGISVIQTGDNLSDSDKQYHREQVKKLATYVKTKAVDSPSVYYVINLQNEDSRYICALYKDSLSDSNQINKCFDRKSRGRTQ